MDAAQHQTGYRYVESRDPSNGVLYRYTYGLELRPIWTPEAIARQKALDGKGIGPGDYTPTVRKQEITQLTARYGISWEDLSTKEDRDHWIAGGALRIIDLQTNEVIAERVGYMIDTGQGHGTNFRSPWNDARSHACPAPELTPDRNPYVLYRTRNFALSILKPPLDE
ncbi:MAG: hypothetical protein Q7U28_01465 [Aquabacterium sp.]|nr:hypothetical protein [Aquabacterium sp.]